MSAIQNWLDEYGLITDVMDCDRLPEHISQQLQVLANTDINDYSVLLFANAGKQFWQQLKIQTKNNNKLSENPVDDFSEKISRAFIKRFLPEAVAIPLYPSRNSVPLIALGETFGWSTPSRLGLGIHKEYGLWFAYRALYLLDSQSADVSEAIDPNSRDAIHHCLACTQKPCVSACPNNAVDVIAPFNVQRCFDYRRQNNSTCLSDCHARRACPIGKQYEYSQEQLGHHMWSSLAGLQRWLNRDDHE